jgi:serine/threonine-protein kinase
MGTVWLARMTGKHGFERLVALKTILASYGSDRQFCDMFLDEARIAAQIDHENVARILEIGEDRGVLYHAMELIDGESLRKLYRDIRSVNAPFPLAVALRIAADTCAGLSAVHELRDPQGVPLDVVHRDISPQNILVSLRGTVKLIDFGVAKARQRRTEETTAGTLKGKLEYMAPEQARGEQIDRRADVYAVGAVLYELLAGEPVRKTEEGRQLLALHELMTGAPYEPLHPSIPLPVRALVDRALARDPSERYRTADEMRHALEHAMVAIGQQATTDDVANVLAHFSRERTMRRKEAIDAAVRTAQAMSQTEAFSSGIPQPYAAQTTPQPNPRRSFDPYSGPQGTQVIGVAQVPINDGPSTGPSLRTMQGATYTGAPPPHPSSATRVFGAVVVLSFVAVLGVGVGVLVSRSPGPSAASSAASPTPPASATTALAASGASTGVGGGATTNEPATPGTILGASDAGAGGVIVISSPPGSAKPDKKRPKGSQRPGGQKTESGDEYGF